MRVRKMPVEVDAWPVRELLYKAAHKWAHLPPQIVAAYDSGSLHFLSNAVSIKTLEGIMTGDEGDLIICGVKGELYPCKFDIFSSTYQPAEDQAFAEREPELAKQIDDACRTPLRCNKEDLEEIRDIFDAWWAEKGLAIPQPDIYWKVVAALKDASE